MIGGWAHCSCGARPIGLLTWKADGGMEKKMVYDVLEGGLCGVNLKVKERAGEVRAGGMNGVE